MRRPSPSMVVATVALIAAGAGGGYAANDQITGANIKNNSVTSADLRNGAGVRGIDVRNNSLTGRDIRGLTGADIRNGSIRLADLSPEARAARGTGAAGPQGPQGPPGVPGPVGATGPQGPPGPTSGDADVSAPPSTFPTSQVSFPVLTVTTTSTGRLYITLNTLAAIACGPGAFVNHWIVLDGQPIESSLRVVGEGTSLEPLTATGVTEQPVAAGEHTVQGALACSSGGASNPIVFARASAAAVVLG